MQMMAYHHLYIEGKEYGCTGYKKPVWNNWKLTFT
jgi:hypothetical protein